MPHALVIGIDHYAAKRVPSLKCAVNDAEEITVKLESAGFDVVTLTNDGATRREISRELEVGLNDRVTDEDDPVVIYWAGHGMTDLRDTAQADKGWATFLLPFDADVEQPLASAFPVQQVWALLDRLRTRRLLVMLDTCFSGAFAEDARGFSIGSTRGESTALNQILKMEGHGRIVVSACGPDQVARESPKQGHGYFTQSFLSAVDRGTLSNGHSMKVPELLSLVRKDVQNATRNRQTPYFLQSAQGGDWSIPLPPPAPYQPPLPSWAFVGTSGGVGKTTLSMLTAELLAESGNTVLYLDADIEHFGGTSEWCQRANRDVGTVKTFADHVAAFSAAKTRISSRNVQDRLLDVTPTYLRRHECGKILLLPAARAEDKLFVFDLVAEINEGRSNAVCRQILDAAFDRGIRQGASCIVLDCGAQFDPLVVNCISAAHHPFVVAAARAGARDSRENILSNCEANVDEFNRLRVETVVNRVPSRQALIQHWGDPDLAGPGTNYHWLPFDHHLFQDWEEGRPNFELGYDQLSHSWLEILAASDRNGCDGAHRKMLPTEWDRFSKWALWIHNTSGWAQSVKEPIVRALRRSYVYLGFFLLVLLGVIGAMRWDDLVGNAAEADKSGDGPGLFPLWVSIVWLSIAGMGLLTQVLRIRLFSRRRTVLDDVIGHSGSVEQLKLWFNTPRKDSPWWMIWRPSKRASIEWLHGKVTAARDAQRSPATTS